MTAWNLQSFSKVAESRLGKLLLVLILTSNLALGFTSATRKSVTVDEFALLPNGLALLHEKAFQIDPGVPPLAKMLMALPVFWDRSNICFPKIVVDQSTWQYGYDFAIQNPANYQTYFLKARIVSLFMLGLTCLLAFILAHRFYGQTGAFITLVLVCFSPTLLAHGRLATTDIYLTTAILGTFLAFDLYVLKPGIPQMMLLGIMVGLACLCKFTGILLFFILPLAILIIKLTCRGTNSLKYNLVRSNIGCYTWAIHGTVIVFTALFIINAGFQFHQPMMTMGKFVFVSEICNKAQSIIPGWLPVPLPAYFLSGIDCQLAEKGYDAYLLGDFNRTGFWHYYLIAFLVKLPLPLLVLGIFALMRMPRISCREIPMVVFGMIMFLFFSLAGQKNIGIRYLLFEIPIGCIWIGRLTMSSSRLKWNIGDKLMPLAIGAGCIWLVLVSVTTWPNYLSYFNILSGGSTQGRKYLLDSNLDWGQDLTGLKEYMDANKIQSVDLAYFGRVPPELYGIRYQHLFGKPQQRYVVISANHLWGRMYFLNGTGYRTTARDVYAAFRKLDPVTVIGHTLYVYDMEKVNL